MRFQSVGSQYTFRDAWSHLFAHGDKTTSATLRAELEHRFSGKAYLYANGRSALAAALKPLVTPSDEVAINGFTCYVVQEAVRTAGASPLFLDVDLSTLHFSDVQLRDTIAAHPNLRAIVIQNTFGIPCDIVHIEAFAREHQIVLIEDLAHSVGLTYADGRKAGTVGDLVMLSFGRDKLLDCVSGGALIIRDAQYIDKIQAPVHTLSRASQRRDRWYPTLMWWARALYPIGIGKVLMKCYQVTKMTMRTADGSIDPLAALPAWQASRVLAKLSSLDSDIARRRQLIETYGNSLASSFHHSGAPVRFPYLAKDRARVWDTLRRQKFYLNDTWYDTPIGPARLYDKVGFPESLCPNAVEAARCIINLPTHRYISIADAERIAHIVLKVERESV